MAQDEHPKSDVTVSKNYLGEREVTELNRLTSVLLDIFEDQLDLGRLTTMDHVRAQLDASLGHLGRSVLKDGGRIRRDQAEKQAVREYERFDIARRAERKLQADQELADLKRTERALPTTPRSRIRPDASS